MTNQREADKWHFSKDIPLAFIFYFCVQTAGIVWWAQGQTKETLSNTRRIETMEAQRITERLATLEAQNSDMRGSLTRIEATLARMVESKR